MKERGTLRLAMPNLKREEIKMEVKIISAQNVWSLEDEINHFLRTTTRQVLDIKYQGIGNHSAYSTDEPSAMIILK